jgi:hypothetical protein
MDRAKLEESLKEESNQKAFDEKVEKWELHKNATGGAKIFSSTPPSKANTKVEAINSARRQHVVLVKYFA